MLTLSAMSCVTMITARLSLNLATQRSVWMPYSAEIISQRWKIVMKGNQTH
jgi:hypothetical protein